MPPRNPSSSLRLDDLKTGQVFETPSHRVTRDSIISFASNYDPQPMHLDDAAAADGPFGELVASGWQTLALVMKLMAEARPFGNTPLVGVAVDEIRFLKPLLVDTRIAVKATITRIRRSSKPGRGFVSLDLEVQNTADDQIILTEKWTVLVPA